MDILDARACSLLDCMAGAVFAATGLAAAATGDGPMVWLPLGLGLLAPFLTFAADDRAGPARLLPGPTRHDLALALGTLLALSPWFFAFADVLWRPHLFAGQVGIGVAILTRRMADLREARPALAMTLSRPAPPPPPPRRGPRPYGSGAPCAPPRARR